MDSLRKCLKLDALWKALNTLPETLDDMYDRILSNIDKEYEDYALKVFQWLCFSARPMRIDEMVEVLAIDSTDNFCFSPEQRLPDPCDIITICSTLVSVTAAATENTSKQTTGSQELRLAHFSVKEYLISERLKKGLMHCYHITSFSANISIAQTCLTYLLHFERPDILTAEFDHEFPLIKYAAEFWPWHYRSITNDGDRKVVDRLGCNLVESENSCFINSLRIFDPDKFPPSDLNLETKIVPSPLYYLSLTGVSGVLEMLLSKGASVNAEGGEYGDALLVASSGGHEVVVRLLLENGANVNAEGGRYGNALSAASYQGHEEVVHLLLEKGANVNAEDEIYGNALSAASEFGHEGLVRLLLQNGADVNAEDKYGSAVSAASLKGHEEVVRLLLEKGADVDAQRGRALREASENGQGAVMRLLLKNKADINLVFHDNDKALHGIPLDDHEVLRRLLLEKLKITTLTSLAP